MTKQQRIDLYDILREYVKVNKFFTNDQKEAMLSLLVTLKSCEKPTNYWFTIDRCKHEIGGTKYKELEDEEQ